MDKTVLGERPWDRMPGEQSKWYERFDDYRRSGPDRTLHATWRRERQANGKTGEVGQTPPAAWNNAAQVWSWRERAAAWDDHIRAQRRAAEEQAITDMLERQVVAGQKMQLLAMERLMAIEGNVMQLTPTEARRYFEEGARIEREARGLPGRVDQVNVAKTPTPQVSLADFDWTAAVGAADLPAPEGDGDDGDDMGTETETGS